jgi:hypothetical protein
LKVVGDREEGREEKRNQGLRKDKNIQIYLA